MLDTYIVVEKMKRHKVLSVQPLRSYRPHRIPLSPLEKRDHLTHTILTMDTAQAQAEEAAFNHVLQERFGPLFSDAHDGPCHHFDRSAPLVSSGRPLDQLYGSRGREPRSIPLETLLRSKSPRPTRRLRVPETASQEAHEPEVESEDNPGTRPAASPTSVANLTDGAKNLAGYVCGCFPWPKCDRMLGPAGTDGQGTQGEQTPKDGRPLDRPYEPPRAMTYNDASSSVVGTQHVPGSGHPRPRSVTIQEPRSPRRSRRGAFDVNFPTSRHGARMLVGARDGGPGITLLLTEH
ncbi:hypothetical protein BDZ85DRAFT_35134 [Elsinoe ampelina]|uniref:Uncharacterized protein n=1 Tax=Elsinoe ampelina TaxID=302913 RepID=A0A6A6G3W5_9PEZI|nr:hypothetical protein BDZ85DRAFT_35134 [Elsinoe ampelina]